MSPRLSTITSLALAASCVLFSVLLPTVVAQNQGLVQLNQCQGVRARREIRTLSDGERQSFISAIRRLQQGNAPTRYDGFINTHNNARVYAHGFALFFPWHRYFLRLYEMALQESDSGIMLPYWDWSFDSQAPETSIVWTA